ncbi:hypothetical protein H4S04_004723 [Coemansia sp. S16]|nr:hypothetical protein H4S04_004723 [Coemansia sp. S16]KAJ2071788.1 hypothetical protein GGH13_003124 [Coemansia sp. S155-1]
MACAICFDLLFRSSAVNKPNASTTHTSKDRIAALSCGHTFHLECIKSWERRITIMNCPICSVRHVGSILTLFIEPDVEHKSTQGDGDKESVGLANDSSLGAVNSPRISLPLYLDRPLATRCRKLKEDVAALQMVNNKCIAWVNKHTTVSSAPQKSEANLEDHQVEDESKTLPGSYKAYICGLQNTLELLKQAIAEMESGIRHAYPEHK